MLLEIDGRSLMVKFERFENGYHAWLWEKTADDNDYWNTGLIGTSICSPKDQFKKSKGRKLALAKLFKRMNEISAGEDKPEFHLTKADREQIWNLYFKTHKME